MSQDLLVKEGPLYNLTVEIFEKMGMDKSSAELEAKSLLWSNIRGIDSHGVQRIEMLNSLLKNGGMNVNYNLKVVTERPATVLIDADRAPGAVSATHAMKLAIEKAKTYGRPIKPSLPIWTGTA